MARRPTRILAAALLPLGVLVAAPTPLPAHAQPRPAEAGDLWPDFAGWYDETGAKVDVVTPGKRVRAMFSVKNQQAYPLKVTAVDTQVQADQCQGDVKRVTSKANPNGHFPVYLLPGARSGDLFDEWFELSAASRCSQVSLYWIANGIAEQTTTPFPTPTPSITSKAPVPTVTAVPSEQPASSEPPSAEPSTKPEDPARRTDMTPLLIGGGVALLTVLIGLALLLGGRKRA